MTLNEFRAWLEGYSASFADGTPSADQWAEVQRRLSGLVLFSAPGNPAYGIPQWPNPTSAPTYWPGGYPLVTCGNITATSHAEAVQ